VTLIRCGLGSVFVFVDMTVVHLYGRNSKINFCFLFSGNEILRSIVTNNFNFFGVWWFAACWDKSVDWAVPMMFIFANSMNFLNRRNQNMKYDYACDNDTEGVRR
jgi:hypothetical protein